MIAGKSFELLIVDDPFITAIDHTVGRDVTTMVRAYKDPNGVLHVISCNELTDMELLRHTNSIICNKIKGESEQMEDMRKALAKENMPDYVSDKDRQAAEELAKIKETVELKQPTKISLEDVKVNEDADRQAVHSVAHVCLAILQKYKGVPGHDIILSQVPEGMEPHLTKMLWKKGYLTGLSMNSLRLASLGESALKLAMEGGNLR